MLADVWTADVIYYVDNTESSGPSRVPWLISALSQYSSLSPAQEARLKPLGSVDDVQRACPSNFNLVSECFAVIIFDSIPQNSTDTTTQFVYTIRADAGRSKVNVENNKSDYERVVLPVQWAVDRAAMEIMGVEGVNTPREWPYTQQTNEEARLHRRLCEY